MVLVKSKFWFRFRLFIQFLPLWSMNDKAEAEQKLLSTSAITFFRRFSQNILDFIQPKQTSRGFICSQQKITANKNKFCNSKGPPAWRIQTRKRWIINLLPSIAWVGELQFMLPMISVHFKLRSTNDTKNQLFCTISSTGYKQTTQVYLWWMLPRVTGPHYTDTTTSPRHITMAMRRILLFPHILSDYCNTSVVSNKCCCAVWWGCSDLWTITS